MNEQLYDVIIYHLTSRKVERIAGTNMRLNTGFHNAEKRCNTVMERINEYYDVAIVPAGKYKAGDGYHE